MRQHSLARNSVLTEWRWDCYQLTGLVSSFFRSLVKISQSQLLWDFYRKQGRRRFPTFSQNLTKEKKLCNQAPRCARKRPYYAMPIIGFFHDVFLHF